MIKKVKNDNWNEIDILNCHSCEDVLIQSFETAMCKNKSNFILVFIKGILI